jgi:hypothetical protein
LNKILPHVTLKFAQLDALVIALPALVRLLVGVTVSDVTHQLTGGREATVAELAVVRLRAWRTNNDGKIKFNHLMQKNIEQSIMVLTIKWHVHDNFIPVTRTLKPLRRN